MFKKILFYVCLCIFSGSIFSGIIIIKSLGSDKKEQVLNYFAQYYFDEQYYLQEYPDVKNLDILPFEHYIQIGWKEDKNPNTYFDNKLYRKLYLTYDNKYNSNPLAHYLYYKISFKNNIINSKELKKAKVLEHPKYYLSLVAIFRDEARFLKEWIEFYRLIGVEHFYLYNHLSKDGYSEVLDSYIKEGIVELYNVTKEPTTIEEWNTIQTQAYSTAAKLSADQTEWLMMVDTDEFLFPVQEKNLANVLKNYDDYASVSVNWEVFGSSDIQTIPRNKLLIETLLHKGTNDLHVKTIVKPRYVDTINNPHYVVLEQGYAQVTENFEYFFGPFMPKESRDILRINHYWSRDLDFLYSRKIDRVHVINKKLSTEEVDKKIQKITNKDRDNSKIYDVSILKYTDELRARVFH